MAGKFRYSPEFRQKIFELVRAGRSPTQLAREFDPSLQTILDEGLHKDRPTTAERDELAKVRSKLK